MTLLLALESIKELLHTINYDKKQGNYVVSILRLEPLEPARMEGRAARRGRDGGSAVRRGMRENAGVGQCRAGRFDEGAGGIHRADVRSADFHGDGKGVFQRGRPGCQPG